MNTTLYNCTASKKWKAWACISI